MTAATQRSKREDDLMRRLVAAEAQSAAWRTRVKVERVDLAPGKYYAVPIYACANGWTVFNYDHESTIIEHVDSLMAIVTGPHRVRTDVIEFCNEHARITGKAPLDVLEELALI